MPDPMPIDTPANVQPMNPVFAKRLKSFIDGTGWWDIAQKIRAEAGPGAVWSTFVANIADIGAMDVRFARSINWSVDRMSLDFTNVQTYSAGNWWYLDATQYGAGENVKQWNQSNLAVWGWVNIRLKAKEPLSTTRENAQEFVKNMIAETAIDIANCYIRINREEEDNNSLLKDTDVQVEGVVVLR